MYKYGHKLSSSLCKSRIFGKREGWSSLMCTSWQQKRLQASASEQNSNVFRKRKFIPHEPSEVADGAVPSRIRVVICGGGITGASVAYHLALLGWGKHTLLVEQDKIGGESQWCTSGLAGRFVPSYTELKLAEYSIQLIKELTQKGLPTGWKQVGSLNLGRSFDRMTSFNRMKSQGVAWGIPTEILTPEQCKEKCPLIDVTDLMGGFWIPEDGVCDPQLVCQSFIEEARRMDVRVVEHCAVKKIRTEHGKVTEVETTAGDISCDYFVNCTGFWARDVGTLSKPVVKIPLKAVEHHYLHTKPIEGLDPNTPYVRDFDGGIYFRENGGVSAIYYNYFCRFCCCCTIFLFIILAQILLTLIFNKTVAAYQLYFLSRYTFNAATPFCSNFVYILTDNICKLFVYATHSSTLLILNLIFLLSIFILLLQQLFSFTVTLKHT